MNGNFIYIFSQTFSSVDFSSSRPCEWPSNEKRSSEFYLRTFPRHISPGGSGQSISSGVACLRMALQSNILFAFPQLCFGLFCFSHLCPFSSQLV